MKYVLLIYADERVNMAKPEDELQGIMNAYWKFTSDIQESGKYVAGEALQPTMTATTVRVQNGKTVTSDGPFAETKEQLGGFYIIDAENLDEAIEWAARIPDANGGSIEIRPIMEFN